jgi:hypothetical protein
VPKTVEPVCVRDSLSNHRHIVVSSCAVVRWETRPRALLVSLIKVGLYALIYAFELLIHFVHL